MGRTSNARPRLLNAASDLLWEKSYHSVTVDEVCARAGVRKGSLYHFFDSKSALAVAALQHFWETLAKPAFDEHFSRANPPLAGIACFLDWLQCLQREKHRQVGKVLGWPFFNLGCELGDREPVIAGKLCELESAELRYFESAIRDAITQEAIESCAPRAEAISLRAAIAGILARARILDQPDELNALTALPITVLRLKPEGKAIAIPEGAECCEAI
jgi:TetR/AcrR family transcriptional repressor of nem operon